MKKTIKKKGMSGSKKVAIGAGVVALGAAAAASAAGAYYLLGPNSKVHQKKDKELMGKIKREAMSEFKKAKKAGTPVYNKAVDMISQNYAKQYKAHEKDIKAIANKLKSEWKDLEKTAKKTTKKVAKVVKSAKKKLS